MIVPLLAKKRRKTKIFVPELSKICHCYSPLMMGKNHALISSGHRNLPRRTLNTTPCHGWRGEWHRRKMRHSRICMRSETESVFYFQFNLAFCFRKEPQTVKEYILQLSKGFLTWCNEGWVISSVCTWAVLVGAKEIQLSQIFPNVPIQQVSQAGRDQPAETCDPPDPQWGGMAHVRWMPMNRWAARSERAFID